MLESTIGERVSRYQETDEPISEDDAVALARRIRNLYLSDTLDGHAAYMDFLTGQCLTLKEGSTMPDEYITASAQIKLSSEVSERSGLPSMVGFNLAIPVGLDRAFGSESFDWLCSRCKSVAREHGRRTFPSVSFTDHFGFVLDRECHDSQRESVVPVVLAPDEDTIAQYIETARTSAAPYRADYWDALVKAAAMLREYQQSTGDTLQGWLVEAADRKTERSDGRKADRKSKNALRKLAFDKAVEVLEQCGIPPTRNRDKRWLQRAHGWEGEIEPGYNPPAGRTIVAKVFGHERLRRRWPRKRSR